MVRIDVRPASQPIQFGSSRRDSPYLVSGAAGAAILLLISSSWTGIVGQAERLPYKSELRAQTPPGTNLLQPFGHCPMFRWSHTLIFRLPDPRWAKGPGAGFGPIAGLSEIVGVDAHRRPVGSFIAGVGDDHRAQQVSGDELSRAVSQPARGQRQSEEVTRPARRLPSPLGQRPGRSTGSFSCTDGLVPWKKTLPSIQTGFGALS